ncbi:MAG TPA: hypothetical protein VH186_09140 [Chloroflexia bacterium]|nr:hypothetical protein [Chloroflexia bacterium]
MNGQVKKPSFTPLDRFLLGVLASSLANWKQALLILKPDTLLRWHRQGFRLFWKLKSKSNKNCQPKIAPETIDLILLRKWQPKTRSGEPKESEVNS